MQELPSGRAKRAVHDCKTHRHTVFLVFALALFVISLDLVNSLN